MAKDNKQKGNSLEELTKYQYGAVAGTLIGQSVDMAKSALEFLVDDYLTLDKATKEVLNKSFADPKGKAVKDAAEIYSNAYNKARSSLTIGNLVQYYDAVLKGYLNPEESGSIRAELGRFDKETYGDIMKKFVRAKYVIEGEGKYDFTEEEMNGAKSIDENYKTLMQLLQFLEEAKLKPLIDNIEKKGIKDMLKAISGKLKQEQDKQKKS